MKTCLYQITETSSFMMSYVLKTASGKAVVIDGGRPEDLPLLWEIVGDSKVCAWILTHPHLDHISGFTSLIAEGPNKLWPEKVYYNFPSPELLEKDEKIRTLREFSEIEPRIADRSVCVKEKDVLQMEELRIEFLQAYEPDNPISNAPLTGNENGLVFRVEGPNKTVLFLGDIGPEGGDRLYQRHWQDLKSDYVQMAHHGHNGVGAEVYLAASPEACLWNCPDWLYEEGPKCFGKRMYGTVMTRKWMEWMGVKKHYVTKDGTHQIEL